MKAWISHQQAQQAEYGRDTIQTPAASSKVRLLVEFLYISLHCRFADVKGRNASRGKGGPVLHYIEQDVGLSYPDKPSNRLMYHHVETCGELKKISRSRHTLTSKVLVRHDVLVACFAAMPASPSLTGSGSNFSSPVDVAQANAALHGHGRLLIDNLAYAPFGSAAATIITSPAPMQPQATLGAHPSLLSPCGCLYTSLCFI